MRKEAFSWNNFKVCHCLLLTEAPGASRENATEPVFHSLKGTGGCMLFIGLSKKKKKVGYTVLSTAYQKETESLAKKQNWLQPV